MNIVPASMYLTDFSQENTQDKLVISSAVSPVYEDGFDVVDAAEKQAVIKQGCNDGLEEKKLNTNEASEKLALLESRLRTEYQNEIAQLKTDLAEKLAENLHDQFEQGLTRIENNISKAVLSAIKPFVDSSIKNKIIIDLVKTIENVSYDLKTSVVTLSGCESKIEVLKTLLENMGFKVNCTVIEQNEITVEIDDIWIETRFEEWEKILLGFSQAEASA